MTDRLGRIQRQITRAFIANPGREFYTSELAEWCYPALKGPPGAKHRWAIVRAAERVAYRVRRDWPGGVVWMARVHKGNI